MDLYRFVWNIYCDWYVELAKPVLFGTDEDAKAETQAMAAWALDQILKLLHPFMPFITEELWDVLGQNGPQRESLLCLSAWPKAAKKTDAKAVAEIRWLIQTVSEIRSLKSEMNIPPSLPLPLTISGAGKDTKARVKRYAEFISRLARLESIELTSAPKPGSVQFVVEEATMALALSNVIDLSVERERLNKEIGKLAAEVEKIDAKLKNEQFVAKAPEDIVAGSRERKAEAEAAMEKLRQALNRLDAAA
jgi:valyl-tRNA synthetase